MDRPGIAFYTFAVYFLVLIAVGFWFAHRERNASRRAREQKNAGEPPPTRN